MKVRKIFCLRRSRINNEKYFFEITNFRILYLLKNKFEKFRKNRRRIEVSKNFFVNEILVPQRIGTLND
jgi:hypothetical protein